MMINLIAAFCKNKTLGNDQKIPWFLPNDFAWFKKQTLNHCIIMGRRTFDSIGRILPHRQNIVITRQILKSTHPQLHFVSSLKEAVQLAHKLQPNQDCFIIGGAQIYAEALPFANRLYLTEIDANFKGDAYFPYYSKLDWDIIFSESHQKDERHQYNYKFNILIRKTHLVKKPQLS